MCLRFPPAHAAPGANSMSTSAVRCRRRYKRVEGGMAIDKEREVMQSDEFSAVEGSLSRDWACHNGSSSCVGQ